MATDKLMQALIFEGPNRLSLREIPRPEPLDREVLIRVHAAAICGTDVRIVTGRKTRDVRRGHPIGHECGGSVAAVGAGVTEFAPGDRVALCVVVSCGTCAYCRADKENLCQTRITLGYQTDGAFAEYMLIPAHAVQRGNLFRLPDEIPMELAPLLEPMACCINGQHEMRLGADDTARDANKPESLVIFGAGPIGLLHLMLARARGAGDEGRGARGEGRGAGDKQRREGGDMERGKEGETESALIGPITVVEPRLNRRTLATELGADHVCAPTEFNAAHAFDAAILAVGSEGLVNVALQAVKKSGKVSLFAGFDKNASVAIDPNLIHYHQIRVTGASESRRCDYAEAMSLVRRDIVDPSPLLTHRFRLDDYEEAFRVAADGSALKVVFEM